MDELRIEIWDHLFRQNKSVSVTEIAAGIQQDAALVRAAVDHPWFQLAGEEVSISRVQAGN